MGVRRMLWYKTHRWFGSRQGRSTEGGGTLAAASNSPWCKAPAPHQRRRTLSPHKGTSPRKLDWAGTIMHLLHRDGGDLLDVVTLSCSNGDASLVAHLGWILLYSIFYYATNDYNGTFGFYKYQCKGKERKKLHRQSESILLGLKSVTYAWHCSLFIVEKYIFVEITIMPSILYKWTTKMIKGIVVLFLCNLVERVLRISPCSWYLFHHTCMSSNQSLWLHFSGHHDDTSSPNEGVIRHFTLLYLQKLRNNWLTNVLMTFGWRGPQQ